jgi:hypothetical protein
MMFVSWPFVLPRLGTSRAIFIEFLGYFRNSHCPMTSRRPSTTTTALATSANESIVLHATRGSRSVGGVAAILLSIGSLMNVWGLQSKLCLNRCELERKHCSSTPPADQGGAKGATSSSIRPASNSLLTHKLKRTTD